MEWNVLRYDINQRKVVNFNIFNSVRFSEYVAEMRNQVWDSVDKFVEKLNDNLMYCFWSKAEYEIMVGDLFETDCTKLEKIDVYDQVKPNIMQLARYILNYWANNPRD